MWANAMIWLDSYVDVITMFKSQLLQLCALYSELSVFVCPCVRWKLVCQTIIDDNCKCEKIWLGLLNSVQICEIMTTMWHVQQNEQNLKSLVLGYVGSIMRNAHWPVQVTSNILKPFFLLPVL
jgi:hypothetical protein